MTLNVLTRCLTFKVMCDHTFSKLAHHHTLSGLSAWRLHMVTLIFLRGLCGYVWVNVLSFNTPKGP